MYRKRLRARTGCGQCKKRRRKCDETHPVCKLCQRLELKCTWPSLTTFGRDNTRLVESQESGHTNAVTSPVTLARYIYNGYHPFQTQDQSSLLVEAVVTLSVLIRPGVPTGLSLMITCALQEEWVRDSLIAFAVHFRAASSPEYSNRASSSYIRACAGLRSHRMAHDKLTEVEKISCIISSISLGLYETRSTSKIAPVLFHFTAAAHMICQDPIPRQETESVLLIRLAAELSLYHVSALSVLDSAGDKSLRTLNVKQIASALDPPPLSNLSAYEISPLMSGTHRIFILMLDIIRFGRSRHSETLRKSKVEKWLTLINHIEFTCSRYYHGLPLHEMNVHTSLSSLLAHCLRIILRKISDDKVSSSDKMIQTELTAALNYLNDVHLGMQSPSVLVWPLLILLCAADTLETFTFLVERSLFISPRLSRGHDKWQAMALERIMLYRKNSKYDTLHDGLELLVHTNGILGT